MALWIVVFAVSLLALLKSADWFTKGAQQVGLRFGVPSYVIGVTVVAAGTSLPELVSSIFAVTEGSPEIVSGNVVGSNITNICLILALAAIVGGRVRVQRDIKKVDLPILTASAALFGLTALDGTISRVDGFLLLCGAVTYAVFSVQWSKSEPDGGAAAAPEGQRPRLHPLAIVRLVVGVVLLYFAARYTIRAVVELSAIIGVGADVIAISAVAIGTSLPELVVTLIVARRGQPEMAMGNVLGSNVYNAFAVGGIPALISPLPVTDVVLMIGLPFMGIATALCLFMAIEQDVTRWEAIPLVLIFLAFLSRLFAVV